MELNTHVVPRERISVGPPQYPLISPSYQGGVNEVNGPTIPYFPIR